jgi:hypothetical protein
MSTKVAFFIMNKKQKTEKCIEILYKYNVNERVTLKSDHEFLLDIFENHSEWEKKKGYGIEFISIAKNKFNKCFQLNRVDGTTTDISFTHCIKERTKIDEVKMACRSAIRDEIANFKKENVVYGITKCPYTNEVLTAENTHIDHYDLTFIQMFNFWAYERDIDYLWYMVNETKDNEVETYFTDEKIKNDFIKFHNENCKLRAVSKKANLSILK